jgi:hypothetical protein
MQEALLKKVAGNLILVDDDRRALLQECRVSKRNGRERQTDSQTLRPMRFG